MHFELISGYHESSKLLYISDEGMLFHKTRQRNGQTEFLCYQELIKEKSSVNYPRCFARAIVHQNKCIRNATYHSDHGNHNYIFNELCLLSRIKESCRTSGANLASHKVSTKEIFYRELARFTREYEQDTQLDYDKLKRQLLRIKNQVYPKIPRTVQEIQTAFEQEDVQAMFGSTLDEKNKLYFGTLIENDFSFIVFASEKVINMIKKCIPFETRHYLIDGTFQVVPRNFYQLIVISIEFKNDVSVCPQLIRNWVQIFPVFYVLSTRKTEISYKAIFHYIEKIFHLEAKEYLTDFETGLRKALNEVYPNTVLRGCWFHFCSAVQRKCDELGLRSIFFKDPEARLFKKALMNLPLLPSDDLLEGYRHIKRMIKRSEFSMHFSGLISYFDSYWLKSQNDRNCISVAGLNMRTTSSVESLNSQLNRSFPKHGNIWKFIEQLKSHEFMKATEMAKLMHSDKKAPAQNQRKRKKDKEREAKIDFFMKMLDANEISPGMFLEAMGNRIILPANRKNNQTKKNKGRVPIEKKSLNIKKSTRVKSR